jgi:hypothetical protein
MSFMDKYSAADYTSTFEDASKGASQDSFQYLYSLTDSPQPLRIQNDATLDTSDEDFLVRTLHSLTSATRPNTTSP